MIEAPERYPIARLSFDKQEAQKPRFTVWRHWTGQLLRFGMVGGLNTLLDLLMFNALLWLFLTTSTIMILLFNSLAYSIGAMNSFFLNKYWTFAQRQRTTWKEVSRFTMTTLLGVACNDVFLWCANMLFAPLIAHSPLWMNVSKGLAIAGTVFISYLGMRLWVFARRPHVQQPARMSTSRASMLEKHPSSRGAQRGIIAAKKASSMHEQNLGGDSHGR